MFSKHNYSATAGFTLIELILYIGIASLVLGAVVNLAWAGIYASTKQMVSLTTNQELRWVMKRISYELRKSSSINTLTANSISLAQPLAADNPTVISYSANRVWLGKGNSGSCPVTAPCALTNSQVSVTQFSFTNLSSLGTKNVKLDLALSYQNPSANQQWAASTSGSMAVELRTK